MAPQYLTQWYPLHQGLGSLGSLLQQQAQPVATAEQQLGLRLVGLQAMALPVLRKLAVVVEVGAEAGGAGVAEVGAEEAPKMQQQGGLLVAQGLQALHQPRQLHRQQL